MYILQTAKHASAQLHTDRHTHPHAHTHAHAHAHTQAHAQSPGHTAQFEPHGVHTVSVADAPELMRQGRPYVDVRTPEEFRAGHPPGAANVPYMLRTARGELISSRGKTRVQKQRR